MHQGVEITPVNKMLEKIYANFEGMEIYIKDDVLIATHNNEIYIDIDFKNLDFTPKWIIDFLYEHHFDVDNLIGSDLAIDFNAEYEDTYNPENI